jgi:phospholipid/cholesterol/gamma-HCH transport system substrate-binding protein
MPKLRGALRKSFLERNQRVIGLIAIVLLVGGSAVALLLTGGVFASRYNVTAYFSDAAGIQPGDEVTVAGLPAGIVKGLRVEHGMVAMDLGINSDVEMPADSSADIVVQTLLGKEAVNLVAGESDRKLAEGDTIPVARTTTPIDITQLNDISVRLLNESDADALNRLMDEVSQVAAGKGPDVHRLVTGLADLAKAVDDRRHQLGGLIDALSHLSKTLADKDDTIVSLIDNLTPVLGNLAQRQDAIATLLQATDSAAHETADLVRRNRGTLDATLNALHDDLAVIDQHQLDLAATIGYLNQAVQGYSSVGYSSGFPNRWANIFVQSLGPAGIDAILGQCGAVDQLIDDVLGTDCNDTGGDKNNPLPTPSLPPLPTPSLPPLPTPSLPVPIPTSTGGGLPPIPTPSLPGLPSQTPGGGGGGLPLPTPSVGLPDAGSNSAAPASANSADSRFGSDYDDFMQSLLSNSSGKGASQ